MAGLSVSLDAEAIARLADGLAAFGPKIPNAQALVLNRVTTKVRARVVPTLAEQTGLYRRIITKAVKVMRASPQNPRAALYARGGNVSLRYFGAHEVKGGVVATIKGKPVFFEGHYFRRSGRAPNRFMLRQFNGQVMLSASGRWVGRAKGGGKGKVAEHDLTVERSGEFIPLDLVDGATRAAFLEVVERELPGEIAAELLKLLSGL